jgi:hypothetical protein
MISYNRAIYHHVSLSQHIEDMSVSWNLCFMPGKIFACAEAALGVCIYHFSYLVLEIFKNRLNTNFDGDFKAFDQRNIVGYTSRYGVS